MKREMELLLQVAWKLLGFHHQGWKKKHEDEAEKDRTDAFHKREKRPGKLKRYSTMTMTKKKHKLNMVRRFNFVLFHHADIQIWGNDEREGERREKRKRQLRAYSSRNQLRKIMHVSTQKMKEKRKLLATISWIKWKCYSFFLYLSLSLSHSSVASNMDRSSWCNDRMSK